MALDQLQLAELKTRFAIALLNEPSSDPFKAAMSLGDIDTPTALQLAYKWQHDPEVLAEQKRILSDKTTAQAFLPTKEQQARDVYCLANNDKIDVETRLKAHRLYAELRSFIEKPDTKINIPIVGSNVMIITDHGSDDEWEQKASAYQKKLTHGDIDGDTGSVQ